MQPEAKFKRKIVEAFEGVFPRESWTAYVKALNKDGMPDLLLCRPGVPALWLEAKVGDNDLSSAQKLTLSNMDRAGQRALLVHCSSMAVPAHERTIGLSTVARVTHGFFVSPPTECLWKYLYERSFWDRAYHL